MIKSKTRNSKITHKYACTQTDRLMGLVGENLLKCSSEREEKEMDNNITEREGGGGRERVIEKMSKVKVMDPFSYYEAF